MVHPRRSLLIAVALFQFFFLNVFLPGHTRGAITLDGERRISSGGSCCSTPRESERDSQSPSKNDKEKCAVCHFAARVVAPAIVSFELTPLHLLEIITIPAPAIVHASPTATLHLGRGPPAS